MTNNTSLFIEGPTVYIDYLERGHKMAHVVTEPCINKKYTDCVVVCPVDCFHEDKEMLVIDPDVCIDCGAYIPQCPVQVIFVDEG